MRNKRRVCPFFSSSTELTASVKEPSFRNHRGDFIEQVDAVRYHHLEEIQTAFNRTMADPDAYEVR